MKLGFALAFTQFFLAASIMAQGTADGGRIQALSKELNEALSAGDTARVQRVSKQISAERETFKREAQRRGKHTKNDAQYSETAQKLHQNLRAQYETLEFKLAKALDHGDNEAAKGFHRQGADLNKQALGQELPLIRVARKGDVAMAQYFLDNGAKMRVVSALVTYDALLIAVGTARDNSAMIKFLLSRGADVNGTSESLSSATMKRYDTQSVKASQFRGNSPLLVAIEKGNRAHIELLLKSGARTDVFGLGQSPLMRAASRYDVQTVKLLLDSGADPNLKGPNNITALGFIERRPAPMSAAGKKAEIINILKARGGA